MYVKLPIVKELNARTDRRKDVPLDRSSYWVARRHDHNQRPAVLVLQVDRLKFLALLQRAPHCLAYTASLWTQRAHEDDAAKMGTQVVEVPCGCSLGAYEVFWVSRAVVEKTHPKLLTYELLEEGGHFLAAEKPLLFSERVRAFFSLKEVSGLVLGIKI
jgi:pimeloyl-ACP methyl ester carboxylesterase